MKKNARLQSLTLSMSITSLLGISTANADPLLRFDSYAPIAPSSIPSQNRHGAEATLIVNQHNIGYLSF